MNSTRRPFPIALAVACSPLAAVILALALFGADTRQARAEYADGDPVISRLGLEYLGRLGQRPYAYESDPDLHFGASIGYIFKPYFRAWQLNKSDGNVMATAFFQYQGARIEAQVFWGDFFSDLDILRPTHIDLTASYMFQIDVAMIQVGVKYLDFDVPDDVFANGDQQPFPHFATEFFFKAIIFPEKLQGESAVNIMYTAEFHQRFDKFDGFEAGLGILTVSQNAAPIGDVLSLFAQIWFNYRFLQESDGEFSHYRVGAKILKDISSFEHPGMGPWFIELGVWYTGEIAKYGTDSVNFVVLIHFAA